MDMALKPISGTHWEVRRGLESSKNAINFLSFFGTPACQYRAMVTVRRQVPRRRTGRIAP